MDVLSDGNPRYLPPGGRHALSEVLESLDERYERVPKENREGLPRSLACSLSINSRPRHGTLLQSGYVSCCHIRVVLEPVRTILAQACSVLLQPDNRVEQSGVGKSYPSAGYAARVTHVQFESASSFLQMAIKYFFDLDKPCFAPAWLQSHTTVPSQLGVIIPSLVQSLRNPALLPNTTWCYVGSPDLVEHLVIKHAQHHSRVAPVYLALERIYLPKLCASPLTRLRAFREQAGQ